MIATCSRACVCPQANEYSLPSLNAGLEDVKPSLSTSASSDLASSVSQSYSVVTGTIWFTLHWFLKECTQVQQWKTSTTKVVSAEKHKAEQCLLCLISFKKKKNFLSTFTELVQLFYEVTQNTNTELNQTLLQHIYLGDTKQNVWIMVSEMWSFIFFWKVLWVLVHT